jgi:ribosomal protein L2
MALKTFNPTTPSQRQLVIVDRSHLYKGKPVKALTEGLTKSGGRNNLGRITARFIGGGHKRSYRIIDFKRRKFDVEGTVARLEYDPNRTAYIALIDYADGEQAYILAPQRLQRHAASVHPGRLDRPQRRNEAGQGRSAGSFGWHLRSARRSRPGHGDPSPELR